MGNRTKKISASSWAIGSIWRRWDLHVHTPMSMLGTPFNGISWDQYVTELEKLAKEKDIAVIGITDYMAIDGYEKLFQEKIENSRLQSVTLLIPNIELRMLPSTMDGKALNLHILVDPRDQDHVNRIKDALRNLRVEYDGENYGCIRDDLIKFGKAQNPSIDDEAAYRFGIQQFKPDKTQIKNWLEKERWLRSNSLIGVANGKDGISGLPLDGFAATRDEILKWCDFVFSGNPSDRKHYLGQKQGTSSEEIIRQYRSLKPCLHGSDAHSIEQLFNPDQNRFCWIKSDPTFHGLRQILWEPEQRVHIGELPPQHSDRSQVISHVSISDDQNWFECREFALNPALVAVIGEKGSGKTAIADMLAMASGVQLDRTSQSSFINKGGVHLDGVNVLLTWETGETTQARLPNNPYKAERPRVRYLSQDFVERLCSTDHQGIELQRAVEEVVFARLNEMQKEGYSSFGELRNAREAASQSRRDRYRGELASLHKEIERLISAIQERPQKVSLKNEATRKIDELEKQLPTASATVDSEVLDKLNLARDLRKKIEGEASELQRNKRKIESALESYQSLKDSIQDGIKSIVTKLAGLQLPADLELKMMPLWNEEVANLLREEVSRHEKLIQEKTGSSIQPTPEGSLLWVQKEIMGLEEKLAKDEVAKKRLLDLQKEIANAKTIAERLNSEIHRIDGPIQENLKKLKEKRLLTYLEVFKSLSQDEDGLAELYAPLQDAINLLGNEIQFSISVGYHVDKEKWMSKFNNFFDNRRTGVEKKRNDVARVIETKLVPAWKSGEITNIRDTINDFLLVLNADNFPANFGLVSLSLVELYDWAFSTEHINLTYKIRYGETELEHLSPGTRGIALLVLYLLMDEDDTRPLIIDQPEGNLDNSSVFEQLVPYIQQAKQRRQVILITHNPNLVVATDAEQVIVASAQRHASQPYPLIKYVSGALEHTIDSKEMGIREAVCLFLEGGRDAFRVRENRYALEKRQATSSGA
jgi:hypothetical protein